MRKKGEMGGFSSFLTFLSTRKAVAVAGLAKKDFKEGKN